MGSGPAAMNRSTCLRRRPEKASEGSSELWRRSQARPLPAGRGIRDAAMQLPRTGHLGSPQRILHANVADADYSGLRVGGRGRSTPNRTRASTRLSTYRICRCLDLLNALDPRVVFPIKEWVLPPALLGLNDFSHHNSAPVIKKFTSLLEFLE